LQSQREYIFDGAIKDANVMMTKSGDVLVNAETKGGGVFFPPGKDDGKKGMIGGQSVSPSTASRQGKIGVTHDTFNDSDSDTMGGDTLSSEDLQAALNFNSADRPNLPPLLASSSEPTPQPLGTPKGSNKSVGTRPKRVAHLKIDLEC
jgi:hypothetical protein